MDSFYRKRSLEEQKLRDKERRRTKTPSSVTNLVLTDGNIVTGSVADIDEYMAFIVFNGREGVMALKFEGDKQLRIGQVGEYQVVRSDAPSGISPFLK